MILQEHDAKRWNDFVAGLPAGDFMQAWEWGELKSRTGWQPWRLAVEESGEIVAGMQILERTAPVGGRRLFYAPRGPLAAKNRNDHITSLLEETRELAARRRAVALKIDPAIPEPAADYVSMLHELGFSPSPRSESSFGGVQPRYVMKVDISPAEDELLASFHSKWRYNIRLAERKGVVITHDCTRADMDAFYAVLVATAARDKFGIRALSYFHDIWDLLIARDMGGLFLGRAENEIICGAIAFVLGSQCWYVYGASANTHRNLMPNHLMQWEMMRWAKSRGCTVYDMRGVARQTNETEETRLHGLNRFKAGFGAQYVEYVGEFDRVFSPVWYRLFNTAEAVRTAVRHRGRSS